MKKIKCNEIDTMECFFEREKLLVHDMTLTAISNLLVTGEVKNVIEVAKVQIKNTEHAISLNWSAIPVFLNEALFYYQDNEQYEKCMICRGLKNLFELNSRNCGG